jgi:N-acetyl-gamma-glutamyl-phosphate reductase
MTKPTIYIDGEAGTTGLEIRARLEKRNDIEVISIDPAKRKDVAERKKFLNEANLSILCLPDDASREAAAMVENPNAKLLDASTAFRTAPGWTYGFPEMTSGQGVSNPGCYPTGMIALIRPLVDAGLLPLETPITVNAISGYSGGGKELIAICENEKDSARAAAYCLYGFDQNHKHLPEMKLHGGLTTDVIFLPSYSGAFYRGMLINIALRLNELKITAAEIQEALAAHYAGQKYMRVEPLQQKLDKGAVLSPLTQNETNNLQLRVFANMEKEIVILTACLDNLGKGASGAAVQNAMLMLGLSDGPRLV